MSSKRTSMFSVVFDDEINIQAGGGRHAALCNLITGDSAPLTPTWPKKDVRPRWNGALVKGDALFLAASGSSGVTIYINAFGDDDTMAELAVARDAILEQEKDIPPHARAIARDVLPATYGLFIALAAFERKRLRSG